MLGYLFINHDLKVVRALAHRLIVLRHGAVVLRHGAVVEEGEAAQIFANPRHPYTRDLMAAAFKLAAPASEEEEDDEVEVL